MSSVRVSGTEGYAEATEELVSKYESVSFADIHHPVLHLIPTIPGVVCDIGSGTGRDAAGLAAMGHRVLAVEPTASLRNRAQVLHPSPSIEWLDDSLPDLREVLARGEVFNLVMLTAVWMHLDARQRRRAMPNVARLVRPDGMMIMSLRHGPVPCGRRMFAVSAEETMQLAEAEGLSVALVCDSPSVSDANRQAGVSWTRLAFAKA